MSASAATFRARSDAEEIAAADRIVRGRVEAVRTERRPGGGAIETVARVRVVDDYTGGTDRVIEIRELGGTVGDTRLIVPGAAAFVVGDDVLALLERKGGGWRPAAMSHSVHGVRATPEGLALLRQDTGGHAVGGPATPARRSLAEYVDTIRRVRGRGPVRLASPDAAPPVAAALEAASPTYETYRLLGPSRWFEADAGTPILWYRNTLRPSPLDSGNSESEIAQALTAWTAPASATVSLAFGGAREAAASSLLSCGAPPTPGGGIVTYEDPDDDITTSGVIAIGGMCSSGLTRIVNGTTFSRATYGFVIFTTKAEMPQLGSSLFLGRVLTHEIGHAIGLGHTQTDGTVVNATANVMYPSCCHASTPVPPAIGPDDLQGLEFIYPAGAGGTACTFDVSPTSRTATSGGGTLQPFTVTTGSACTWSVGETAAWLSLSGPTTRTGSGTVTLVAAQNVSAARSSTFDVAGRSVTIQQEAAPVVAPTDTDGDGMPDAWETQAGLNPNSAAGADGAAGDPDGDGLGNLQEYQRRLHPLGMVRRYMAEGVQSDFFSTRVAIVNPSTTVTAYVQLRFAGAPDPATGVLTTREHWLTLLPRRRATVDASTVAGVAGSFATTLEANTLVVADRTVGWDGTGYGSHAESATDAPRTTWYFAEGATTGGFNTFYLLLNPGQSDAQVTITYLRAGRAPRTKTYGVRAGARETVWVNKEAWADGDSLASAEVSARIDATSPIIAERAMYLDRAGQLFTAGHDSVGLTAPATRWLLAEGATGPYFDLFILLANPSEQTADVRLRFLLEDGTVVEHREQVPGLARSTVWVDALGADPALTAGNPAYARLADAAVSTDVIVDNGVGVLVERAMWWPGDPSTWSEAHNSGGVTAPATRWALAEGEVGGVRNTQTYVLVSNPGSTTASVTVTMLSENAAPVAQVFTVAPNSRFNVVPGSPAHFPTAAGRRIGMLVESDVPVVVERAMYSDVPGQTWAAGTNAVATKLP